MSRLFTIFWCRVTLSAATASKSLTHGYDVDFYKALETTAQAMGYDALRETVDFYVHKWINFLKITVNFHLHFLHHRSVTMTIVLLFCCRHNWTNLDGHLSRQGLWERREEPRNPSGISREGKGWEGQWGDFDFIITHPQPQPVIPAFVCRHPLNKSGVWIWMNALTN